MLGMISRKNGFSLVEVIVGLAIVGSISVLFVNMFMLANNVYEKSEEKNYVMTKAPLVFDGATVSDIITNEEKGTFTIDFGDVKVSVDGSYKTGERRNGSGERIMLFTPDGP